MGLIDISGPVSIDEPHLKKLESMSAGDREDFWSGLEIELAKGRFEFDIQPHDDKPQRVVAFTRVWRDSITRDEIMGSVQSVVSSMLLVIWFANWKLGDDISRLRLILEIQHGNADGQRRCSYSCHASLLQVIQHVLAGVRKQAK